MTTDICEYLVSHGSGGGVGRFAATVACRRGDRVVVESQRGLELGVVLCAATTRHARLLHNTAVGRLLRPVAPEDEAAARRLRERAQALFADARRCAAELALPFEVIDVELLLDGQHAVVQHLRWADCDYAPFLEALAARHGLLVLMENLAPPAEPEEHGGCGEPGCGRTNGGGGCSSCGSGGCSSCGGGKVDMRAYFAHLREQMEQQRRVPLL